VALFATNYIISQKWQVTEWKKYNEQIQNMRMSPADAVRLEVSKHGGKSTYIIEKAV